MAHQEAFQLPSWQLTFDMASQIDEITFENFSPFTNSTTEDHSDISSILHFSTNNGGQSQATSFPDVDDIWDDLDKFELGTCDEMIMSFINESEDLPASTLTWSPSSPSTAASLMTVNLEEATIRAESLSGGLFHLLKAYGEAEMAGQGELSDAIVKCLQEKVSPVGETLKRLGFYLCPDGEKQGDKDHIRQESGKNMEDALRVFYQFFPNGKLAHFSANSVILECNSAESESIHLVDFDMGEGIQWPPLIEALASKQREVKLTALKWENDQESVFEDTKRRLVHHARSVGLEMKVEEMGIDELVSEIKRGRKRGGGRREFLAFNCMVGFPHMRRVRSRKLVEEFLRVGKESLAYNGSRGVIVMGEGDDLDSHKPDSGFGSFFEGTLAHYETLLSSIESNFPSHLSEARMALETLFVAPSISCQGWIEKWMELTEGCDLQMGIGLEGYKVSRFRVEEAREMVRDLHGSYGVRIGGDQENVLILEWKGVSLVKVSSWRS